MIFAPVAKGAIWLWSMTLVQWVVLALAFLWLWQMNNHDGWHFRPTKLDAPIWLFVGLAVVSCVPSIYKYDSLLSIFRLLTCVIVYYLVVNHFDRRLQLRFAALIVAIGAALSLLGIGQYFFGLDHSWWSNPRYLSATYVSHAHFAGYLEMALALNLGLLLGMNRQETASAFHLAKWRVLLSLSFVSMLTAFVLTQSRGGWIVFAVACIIGISLLVKNKSISKGSLPVFAAFLVLFIVFIGFGADRVAYRLHTIEMSEESTLMKGRIEVWERCIDMIKDRPVTGTGIGTFVWAFPKYRPEGFAVRYHYAHNDYIQMITEMGILVIPVLLWGIFALLRKGLRRDPKDTHLTGMLRFGCAIGILSLMLHGLVDFNFHIPANMLMFVCLAGIVMRQEERKVEL